MSGPPGSGKSTLALPLARALRLPLVAKDTVKEALMDALGAGSLERSRELGGAAIQVMLAVARSHLDAGAGLLLESNFAQGVSEAELRPLAARARAALVHCWAPRPVVIERLRGRATAGGRHPGHFDLQRLEAGPWWLEAHAFEPPELDVPCLRVDTTRPIPLDEVVEWARRQLTAAEPA